MAFEDQLKAGKKFKAPKGYKPMSTKDKAVMAATLVGPGKVAKAVGKTVKVIKAEAKVAGTAKPVSKARALTGPSASKNSVYQLPGRPSGSKTIPSTKGAGGNRNMVEEWRVAGAKSGSDARDAAKAMERWNKMNPKGKKPTVKINTNPYKGK